MVRDQIGVDLDEPVVLGEPLDEETLKSKTTIYRIMVKHTKMILKLLKC